MFESTPDWPDSKKQKIINLHNSASDYLIWMILVSFSLPETGAYEFDTQLTTYGRTKKLHFFRLQLLENCNLDFILLVLRK